MNRRAYASLDQHWQDCFNHCNASWASIREVGNCWLVIHLWNLSLVQLGDLYGFSYFSCSISGGRNVICLCMHYLPNKLLSEKCCQLGLGSWEWIYCRESWYCAAYILKVSQHHCLFCAIVIYFSTQPQTAHTHYMHTLLYAHTHTHTFWALTNTCAWNIVYSPLCIWKIKHKSLHVKTKIGKNVHCICSRIHACILVQPTFPGDMKITFIKHILSYLDMWKVTFLPIIDAGLFSHILCLWPSDWCRWLARMKMSIVITFPRAVLWGQMHLENILVVSGWCLKLAK